MTKRHLAVLIALLATILLGEVRAHKLDESYLYLQIYADRVTGRFEMSLQDLNRAFGRTAGSGEITAGNIEQHLEVVQTYYRERVDLIVGDRPVPIRFTGHSVLDVRGGFLLLPFEFVGLDHVPPAITIDYRVLFDRLPGHRGFLIVEHNWAT